MNNWKIRVLSLKALSVSYGIPIAKLVFTLLQIRKSLWLRQSFWWHETEIHTISRKYYKNSVDFWDRPGSRNTARAAQELKFELGSFEEQRLFLQNWKYSHLSPVVSCYPAWCQRPGLCASLSEHAVPKSLPKGCLSPGTLNLHVLQYLSMQIAAKILEERRELFFWFSTESPMIQSSIVSNQITWF